MNVKIFRYRYTEWPNVTAQQDYSIVLEKEKIFGSVNVCFQGEGWNSPLIFQMEEGVL